MNGSYKKWLDRINAKQDSLQDITSNIEAGTLKYLGKPLYNIINKLDPGHFDNIKY